MGDMLPQPTRETVLGPLPEGWDVAALGDLSERPQYGLTTSAVDKPVGPHFLRITDIQDDQVDWSNVPYCKCDDAGCKRYGLRPGDLVVARIGATTGKTFLISESTSAVFASYLIRIRTEHRLFPEFLNYFTKSQAYWDQINAAKGGRLKQGVNIPILQGLAVPLPPLSEQRAIAHVLRTVQQAKEATEKVIAATRQLKQSLMRHLFTYGPVPFDQADQILLGETSYGKVPAGWLQVPIGQCAYVQTGLTKGRKLGEVETVSLPYLRVANVQSGRLDLAEMKTIELRKQEINRYLLKDGDVVLTEGGDFDKLGRGFIWRNEVPQCVHQNHIFAVRANRTKLLPEFLAYLVQSDYGRSYFLSVAHKTTNLACINKTKLEAFPVLLPPLEEQRQITMQFATVDAKLAAEETRRDALDALFQSLLHHLMTGKVCVYDLELPSMKEDAP